MSQDYNDYFLSRISAPITGSLAGEGKLEEIQAARAEKIQQLTELGKQQLVQEKANAASFAGRMGIDQGSTAGYLLNLGVNAISGTSRGIGDISTIPTDLSSFADIGSLTEDEIQAINRFKRGTHTPEDLVLINTKKALVSERDTPEAKARAQAAADTSTGSLSALELFDRATAARAASRNIDKTFDISSQIHSARKNALAEDLGDGFSTAWDKVKTGAENVWKGNVTDGTGEAISGLAGLLYNAGAAGANHPGAVGEYVAENLPQLLVGGVKKVGSTLLTASNVGYATDSYQKGMEKYQSENKGAIPPEDVRQRMALYAASTAVAEHYLDTKMLKGFAGPAPEVVTRTGFKEALLNPVKATASGAVGETLTEGYQTFAEGEASLTPASAKDIYVGAAIGGLTGGAITGGVSAVHEAAKLASQPSEAKQETIDHAKVQEAAIASGDVSTLTDPVEQIAALFGHSQKADTTQEQKQTNLTKASEIVAALESQQEDAQQVLTTSTIEGMSGIVESERAKLIDPANANDPAKVAEINKSISLAESFLQTLQTEGEDTATVKESKQKLDKVTQQLKEAKTAKDNLAVLVQSKDTIEADIALISAPKEANDALAAGVAPRATAAVGVSKEQTAAADRIITLAMTAPERLDAKVVAALAADTNNALTVPQRAYLSAFLRAQQSNPTLTSSHVAKDIYKGEFGNKGVLQFRTAMGKALAAGNQKMADTEMTGISKFVQAHQDKATAAAQAIKLGIGTSILKEGGQWVVGAPGVAVTAEQHKAGGRTITSGRLALAIKDEAQALADVAAELQAAYDLKFSTPSKVVTEVKPAPVAEASVVEVAEVKPTELTETTVNTEEPLGSSVNTESTQSTEKTKETTEEVKSTTEVTTSETTQPDGKLEVMATKSPEGTPFNLRNLVADNFTQAGGKPLTDVKNFFSSLYAKIDEHPAAIQSFLKHAKVWNERIKAGLSSVGNPDYRYEDMMRFLITDKDGIADVDENLKTAISSVVYLYVASEATSPQYHKDKGINSILGRGKDDWVSPDAREALAHVGIYQYQLVDSLGGAVMEALGFKANPDAGLENEAKLRVALGAHAMKLLEGGNNPLMARHTVSGETMQYLREEGLDEKQLARLHKAQGTTDTRAPHTFFSIARNPDGTVVPGVARIFEANKGSKDILGQLFKAPPTVKLPSLVPVTAVAKTAAGTNQSVPEEQQEALKVMQSREHFVREDSLDFLGEFSEEDQLTMMGVVEEENATTHRVNRISVQAKNDGLRREWANFQEYVGEYLATAPSKLKTAMYFLYSPWKNQRTGIDNTVVNPQTSKIVRALVTSERWSTEVALTDKELMDSFYLGVAEGLGVKTERQDNQLSVDAIIDTLATPIYADAVEAIRKRMIHKKPLSDQEKDAVLLAVAKGGANLHSLDALIGMAYHAEAVATNATTFVSRVYREVDGVANGTMLNHVLLGAAENPEALAAMLEHGGFFGKDSQYTHYSHYRGTPGNMDIYESTGRKVHEEVTAAVGKAGNAVVDSIWAIGGSIFDPVTGIVSKAGRNLVKDGMNPLGFGSALDTVVAKMGVTFVDTIYTGFEKLAKSGAPQAEIDEFVAHINTLIGKTNTKAHIPVNKPIAFYMEMVLKNDSRNAILNSFSSTVGLITSNVLESEFKVFLERRNDLNSAAQTVSGMYDAMQRGIREDYIEQLIASGDIELDKAGNPVSDLSKKQEAELTRLLQSMAPVLRTAMSKNDTKGNGTRSGLLMSKTKRKQSKNPAYATVSKFATGLSTGAKSVKLTALAKFFETIGVSMGSAATHSTDSRIMLMVQKVLDVLGIHDAAIDGIKGAKETANLLNKSTWDTLLNYSPLEEVYLSMANLVQGMAEVIENGDMPPQSLHYVNAFLAEQKRKQRIQGNTLQGLLVKAKGAAHTADKTKLDFMSTSGVIDQYAFQGGQYQVTEDNRDEAAQNLEILSDKIPKEILDALAVVQKALKNPGAMKKPVAPVAEATEATAEDIATTAENDEEGQFDVVGEQMDDLSKGSTPTSPFGELGKPRSAPDAELVEFFKKNPKPNSQTVLQQLVSMMDASKTPIENAAFNIKLAHALFKALGNGVQVVYVTKDTPLNDTTVEKGAAWYNLDTHTIYVLGTDFKDSYLVPEMLLHELVHAATSKSIINESAKWGKETYRKDEDTVVSSYSSPTMTAIKELESLMEQATVYMKAEGLTDHYFQYALTNVHEFIAVGMSNPAFQSEVLANISIKSGTTVSTGLQKFIDVLMTLLGLRDKGGMRYFITNTAVIMKEAADAGKEVPTTGPTQQLITALQQAREKADAVDAWKIEGVNGKLAEGYETEKALITAYYDAYDALMTHTESLVAQAMSLDTPYAQTLQETLDSLNQQEVPEDSTADVLSKLVRDTQSYLQEFSERQPRLFAMAAPTNTYSTLDIHAALADGSLTNEFDWHLRSLLGGIVYNLHGAFGSFKASLMENQAMDATDVWLKALNTGVAPFASEALGHIATTPQVAYALEQVEATVRAALETNESQTKMVYKELYKLYGEAETIVTVQALIDAGLDATTAQATHDMLFKLEQGADKRSNYLARFAALGLAHPVINQVLQAATAKESRKARDGKTFMERLEIVFENIMKMFRTYVTHTYQGQPANDKLLSLVGQLVDIEAKYQRKIAAKANTSNVLEPIEAKLKVFVEAAGAKIEAVAGSNFVRNNKYTAVKLAGGLVGTIAGGRADLFMEGLFRLRAETFKKRFGVVASLAQAYVGQNVVFQGLLRMTKLLEHDRQKEVAGWAKTALEAYVDNGKMLRGKSEDSVAARKSITSVFMRTGAHNLMGDFDMAGIEQLVTSKAALDTAITSFESKLAVHGRAAPYYVNQANALGYKLATGIARTKFVNQNAHAISRLSGTGQESKVSTAQAEQAEATLKVLVTLYALRYSDSTAVGHAARVIKAENARADKMNGLEMTLLLQKRLETESLERLFGNNPMLMVHGYTSEIYDPNVTIKTANVLEGKALLEQGYVKRSEVPRDPADNDQDVKHLYVLQDGGVPRFVSGAMSNKGMKAKGTTIHNGYTNAYNATGIANASQNATLMQDRQAAIADMFRPGPVKDLSKEKGSYLVPVFNESGVVTNWRYMMAESTKDHVLNRNNRFDKVLGTIAGSIYDKETSREQNMTVVKALHDQFKTDYQSNPKSYINIGPKSEDPEMKEIWNLLPEDTREDIREVWGHNGMTVKVENLDIVFGYRKLTVGTIFTKANEERDARKSAGERTEVMALKTIDAWQKLIVMLFEFPLVGSGLKQGMTMEEAKKYARKAGANAVRTEHIWQAIVSETKDIIVVKSGLVLLGNMSSNIWLLGMSGVPILDVMHHHLVAWKGAVSWKKDTEELEHLKRLRATGYTQGNKADIDRRILRLEDALDRNPVKELVEAGLMPTIVEDIDPEDDLYSYKSHLVRKVEGYTDKMNPTLVKAARTAYLAHDTKIYQAMSQMTRLSDFMARYTMYQHLISKKEPLSKQEATQKVSEAFINYDIALHRNIQYTDDMGITMFTKYFIGIQKVLVDTLRENPARVLTGVLLSKFLGLGPTVLDGSMWNHIGNNPFRSGPFELLDALDELPMINAPLALFNMGGSPIPQ